MSLSPSAIAIIILAFVVCFLLFVTQCQRAQNTSLKEEIESEKQQIESLSSELIETKSQMESERRRIIEVAQRLDKAITEYTNGASIAHENHEIRMETLTEFDDEETSAWLCEPVPDVVKRLFGCTSKFSDSGQTQSAGDIDAAM